MATKNKSKSKTKTAWWLNTIGNILIVSALILFAVTLGPVATQEVRYTTKNAIKKVTNDTAVEKEIEPSNRDFSIVIPKIDATAPVFANVDPLNSEVYLPVLRKGVAHAKGTPLPGDPGNVYIFAHSTDAFYNVGRYNAVFYLLGKLQNGDDVFVYYKDQKITYKVLEVKVVSPFALNYLEDLGIGRSLTLQTCYPPGTTLKRLVVVAVQVD